jgi:exosortase/archaeosortase
MGALFFIPNVACLIAAYACLWHSERLEVTGRWETFWIVMGFVFLLGAMGFLGTAVALTGL